MRYFFDFTALDCPAIKAVLKEHGIENTIEYNSTMKKFVTVDDAVKRIFAEAIYQETQKKRISCYVDVDTTRVVTVMLRYFPNHSEAVEPIREWVEKFEVK